MAIKTAASAKPARARKTAKTRPPLQRTKAKPEKSSADQPEPRGARRKRETRTRLLDAALRLMAERGIDGVAINEITEAADVGFGSFYNHFASKEEIYDALMKAQFEGYADTLDKLVAHVADPAEAVSRCVRHVLLRAFREPLWGKLLLQEGHSESALTRGLGQRLLRDMQRGVASGRFRAPDLLVTFLAVGGTVLAAVLAQLKLSAKGSPHHQLAGLLGVSTADLPERTACVLLTTLGLEPDEARRIAHQPLESDAT